MFLSLFFHKSPVHLCQVNRKSYRCMRSGDTPSETWSSRKKFPFFFLYWRFAPFPSAGFTQTTHSGRTDICEHLSRREDLSHKHYETFFFFFSSSKPSPRFIYLLAGWIWNTQESEACRFTSTETTLLRSEETLRRLGSARLKVVLVLIRAVRSRMDYMDSGMRYTPKTSVSYLLRWSSGGGSCWLNVVSPCLCFYLLPGWSVSWDVCVCVCVCVGDI